MWLRSADPADKPRILTNTLAEPEDVDSLVAGMELAREIANTEPMKSHAGQGAQARARVSATARRSRRTCAGGSCSSTTRSARAGWARGEDAVVDPELRVRGIDGLRVVDASVFPIIPGGNTNAPTIMVAEKASDLIRGRAPLSRATPAAA